MQDDTLLNSALALHDTISDNIQLVRSIVGSLESLAHSFAMTGNDHMANKLLAYCDPLLDSAQRVRDASMAKQNAEIRHNEGFSRDLIMGLVGMVEASAPTDPKVKRKAGEIRAKVTQKGELA